MTKASFFKKVKSKRLELVVFLCGGAVMVLELLGSRLLAPYLGTSIYVWASLIGIILGALSLGYWIGGKLADKNPQYFILAAIILTSAFLTALIPLVKDVILLFSARSGIKWGSILAAFFLFSFPALLLGMVSPYALRLKLSSLKTSGNVAGTLYALSTLGSIGGTFLAGFWLIPFFRLSLIILGIGALLAFVAVLTSPHPKILLGAVLVLFFLAAVYFIEETSKKPGAFLFETDSAYNHIRVYESFVKDKGPVRLLMLASEMHSAVYLNKPEELVFPYTKFYRLGDFFMSEPRRALMIGGGGYSVPRDFLRRHPKSQIDVVEIDPKVTQVARRFFLLKKDPRMKIIHQDGRSFLNANNKRYDIIFNDAFNSSYAIPYELTTKEALERMKEALTGRGVLIINLISALGGEKGAFFQAEYKTIKTVFPKVYIFPVSTPKKEEVQNIMLVALKDKDFNLKKERQKKGEAFTWYFKNFTEGDFSASPQAPLLTDDYAPVEYLISKIL